MNPDRPAGERKHLGYVRRTQDKTGRVKVFLPQLHAEGTPVNDLPDALPCIPGIGNGYGMFVPVQVGDQVWVDFDPQSDRCIYSPGPAASGELPPEFQDNKAFGFKTPSGHVFCLVDRGGEEAIYLKTAQGHKVTLDDANQKIGIESKGGHKFTLDDSGTKVEIETSTGHKFTLDPSKITTAHSGGAKIEIEAGQITHTAPVVKVVGNLQVAGSISTTGGGSASIDGDITGQGSLDIQGDVETHSDFLDPKGNLTDHTNEGLTRD